MTLVHKATLQPWSPPDVLRKTMTTATQSYADGRTETVDVEPYEVEMRAPPTIEKAWSDAELAAVGLARPLPAAPPTEGKRRVGSARYAFEGDSVVTVYDIEDIPPPTARELKAHAAARRFDKEVGGCLWNALPVHTDRESQGKIVAERLAIEAGERQDPDGWKFRDGQFRMVTNAEFSELATAVRAHVRSCYAIEAQVIAGVTAGTITTTAQINEAFA